MLAAFLLAPRALAADTIAGEALPDTGADIAQAFQWDLAALWEFLLEATRQSVGQPVQLAIQTITFLVLSCMAGLLAGQNGWQKCIDAVSVLGFGAISLGGMMELVNQVGQTAQDCQTYLIGFVPVYTAAAAAGGQTSGAAVYSTMFYAMSTFLSGAIRSILMPVMQIYFCFGVSAAVWGNAGIAEAASLFSKCLSWLLKLCGALFSFVLGLQNILAGCVDNAAIRMGRGVLSGAIPVVGDAAAAALSGAVSAVQLLKGSLALAAVLVLGGLFVPVFLRCLLFYLSFSVAGIVAAGSGQKQCWQICRNFAQGARICGSILTLYFFMVFLSTALLLISGTGGG